MRVVAGEFKGRRLNGPSGGSARPTSDKVREALFSILGPIDGHSVLDLFAGTGALGIEALSRGAARVVFVERDSRMRAVLKSNLQVTAGAAEQTTRAAVIAGDAIDYLRRAAAAERFDLVLLDPPYAEAVSLAGPLARGLAPILAPGARVVAECDHRTPLMLEAETDGAAENELVLLSERRYGDTLLRILTSPIAP